MNIWQIARQIQYRLRATVWPGSSTKVWNSDSVKIVEQGEEREALMQGAIPPLAIIAPVGGGADPVGGGEEFSIVERFIDITLLALNQADRIGEAAVVGATRQGATDSRGRGVLELEPVLFSQIGRLTAETGVAVVFGGFGASAVRNIGGDNWVAIQDYQFRAFGGTAKFYHPPVNLLGAAKTGQVDLTWKNPPDRWDRYRVRLVRKAGSTAPTSISDGTVVTLSGNLPVSHSDTGLTPGTYSYSLFASYSEFDASPQTDDAYSDPATVSGVSAF